MQLPFAFLPLLRMIGRPALVGRFANSRIQHILCWLLAIIVLGLNIFIVVDFAIDEAPKDGAVGFKLGAAVFLIVYAVIVTEVVRDELAVAWTWMQERVIQQMKQYEPTPSTSGSYVSLGGDDETVESCFGGGGSGMAEGPVENDPRDDFRSTRPMMPPRSASV